MKLAKKMARYTCKMGNSQLCAFRFETEFINLLSENSDSLFSFSFQFLQNLSNPLLFAHCCCYFKELTCLNCVLMQKSQFRYVNSLKYQQQCVKSSGFDKFCKNQKENENNKCEFSDKKIDTFGLQNCLKFAFKITLTKPDIL